MSIEGRLLALKTRLDGPDNSSIDRWRGLDRPVIGHFCSYVPVELITAAGALPVRVRGAGSDDSGAADAYLSSRTCTYVRHTLSLALDGRYDFLDGVVCLNTCDHVRRAHDLWRHKAGLAWHGFLSVPRSVRKSLFPYYMEEVRVLQASLEGHLGVTIGDRSLQESIKLHNRVRKLLGRIDELRGGSEPGLSGAQMLTLTIASQVMPPEEFLEEGEGLAEELEATPQSLPKARARLLLAGAELDEPGFVAAIESQGAHVAADSLCFGMRAHHALVEEDAPDPVESICRRYFFQVPCARMIGNFPDRYAAMLETVERRAIDGIVFQRLKFCDPWGGESHNLRHRLKDTGLPILNLEREYGRLNVGQVKTRVQAFLELIESLAGRPRGRVSPPPSSGASEDPPVPAPGGSS